MDNNNDRDDTITTEQTSETPKYDDHREKFCKFLLEHTITVASSNDSEDDDDEDALMIPTNNDEDNPTRQIRCYRELMQRIKDRRFLDDTVRTFVVQVPLTELSLFDEELAEAARNNTMRYISIFTQALDKVLEETIAYRDPAPARDTVDFLEEHRRTMMEQQQQNTPNPNIGGGEAIGGVEEEQQQQQRNTSGATEMIPPEVMRRFELRILPHRGTLFPFDTQVHTTSPVEPLSLRQVRAKSLGKLVSVTGMVVRSSDVKPCCVVATYACDGCGVELYQLLTTQREFMPIFKCPNCKKSTVHLQTRGSKFSKYQEVRIQELASHVPMGQVPRSVMAVCRGELSRKVVPGDIVTMDAVFLPQRLAESGYKAMKAGLIVTTYLEAQNIIVHKKSFDTILRNHDTAVDAIAHGTDPVGQLASSIAPEIYGHGDIKRALLLMLVAGVTRKLPDGMRIRGDINVLLMGDPGVAKSQLLKAVSTLAPRAVYTTGKGSSGVGLTAAVTKDAVTGEMALEGGALVLADRGICCIDEFDKVCSVVVDDEGDRGLTKLTYHT